MNELLFIYIAKKQLILYILLSTYINILSINKVKDFDNGAKKTAIKITGKSQQSFLVSIKFIILKFRN